MMKALGIYFGPKFITLVETEGFKVINRVNIPLQRISGTGLEEKIPEEIKVAAAIKDELRKNNIEAKEANLVLLGRDLIIRTFHMPVLPLTELGAAVRFEAKKYIPFKVEELVYDFQVFLDRANHKNLVLFVGLKKESLNKYTAIFNQLNIKIASVEYAGFSILRLLQLARIREKGIFVVLDIDLVEEDEVNFIVLENGFPLFSRDIILSGEAGLSEYGGPAKVDLAQSLEKLKVEMRISLDFYLRKFPTKNISSIVVIAPEDYRQEVESFVRERGLEVKFVDSRKFPDRPMVFSLGYFKAYAANLKKNLKSVIKIDLSSTRVKQQGLEQRVVAAAPFALDLKINVKVVLLSLAVIFAPFVVNFYRQQPMRSEIATILGSHPLVKTVKPDLGVDELNSIDSKYKEKVKVISGILRKRMFITGALDSIPRIIPEGLWLRELNFRKAVNDSAVLTIKGSCYMADNDKERKLINKFLKDLKSDRNFNRNFKEINILSLGQEQKGKSILTGFVIECRS
jgi:hypothetical protein